MDKVDASSMVSAGAGLQSDLDRALRSDQGELVLEYQPVVDLASGRVTGVESLMRWQHPTLGRLSPNKFIGLAEATGMVDQLGDWVLDRVVRDAADLVYQGRELDVSLNLSAQQLSNHLVEKVRGTLGTSGVRPERLTLEVTESAFVSEHGVSAETYQVLSGLGVKFAIDDFGTSFSSRIHLRRYPIDALKIDGDLVAGLGRRPDDEALCDSIISLAGVVGATTVAEKVETAQQYAVLRFIGCKRGQGFLWSPAVPIRALNNAITRSESVPVATFGSRLPRVFEGQPTEVSLIAQMHAQGASTHSIAEALNRIVGRHPSGVRWTAGAVARGLPRATTSV